MLVCFAADKSFAGAMYRHNQAIHEGHKGYKCESCDKSYTKSYDLKKHIHTVHEGHKDYKCDSCDKSFTTLQTLEFMMDIKITNVNLVANHILMQKN